MPPTDRIALDALTADHFSPQIGHDFCVRYPDFEETLTLQSVERRDGPPEQRAPFALVFDGRRTDLVLNQHIHPLSNDALGTIDVFLVPVGRNADGTIRYQATFT